MLDFGTCARLSPAQAQTVVVYNNTDTKLAAYVQIPPWLDTLIGSQPVPIFQAFPEVLDLPAHSSGAFKLVFRPPRDGVFYLQKLHVCAYVKAQRSYKLVQDHQVRRVV